VQSGNFVLGGCWTHLEAIEFGEVVFESGQACISLVYSLTPNV